MSEISSFLEYACEEAARAIRANRGSMRVSKKGNGSDRDLVSNLDILAEKVIIDLIQSQFQHASIVSEEASPNFDSNTLFNKDCFVIDPIDGSINFINGLPLWGTQIAYLHEGELEASAICLPDLGRLYSADKSAAVLNGNPISVSGRPLEDGIYSIEGLDRTIARPEMLALSPHLRELYASCASFSFVAEGSMVASIYYWKKPWDWMPGKLLVESAGGCSFDSDDLMIHAVANSHSTLAAMLDAFEGSIAARAKQQEGLPS